MLNRMFIAKKRRAAAAEPSHDRPDGALPEGDHQRRHAPTTETRGGMPANDLRAEPQRQRHAEHYPRRSARCTLFVEQKKNAEERAFSVLCILLCPRSPARTRPAEPNPRQPPKPRPSDRDQRSPALAAQPVVRCLLDRKITPKNEPSAFCVSYYARGALPSTDPEAVPSLSPRRHAREAHQRKHAHDRPQSPTSTPETCGDKQATDQRSPAVISRPQSTTRDRPQSPAPTPEASGALHESDPRVVPQRQRPPEHYPRHPPAEPCPNARPPI